MEYRFLSRRSAPITDDEMARLREIIGLADIEHQTEATMIITGLPYDEARARVLDDRMDPFSARETDSLTF